ncbi:MAG: peptidoglycan -binding protein [Dongiaceae bacterium]
MAGLSTGRRARFEPWPGYVDVLSTLLMVIIFVLMVFVIAQFFLSSALSGRDKALDQLNKQVAELADMLALERQQNADMRTNIDDLSSELAKSTSERDALNQRLTVVLGELNTANAKLADTNAKLGAAAGAKTEVDAKLEDAYKVIEADKAKIQALLGDIAALQSLRDEMAQKLAATDEKAKADLSAQAKLSEEAALRVEILNRQILALRQQLADISQALDISESKTKAQDVTIADLGKRLNEALASKVEELARYRSEFFGKLRQVLGDRRDVQIVGDRFVFQSEVLFDSGSADLGAAGQEQLGQLAKTLLEISKTIPGDIDWVLRIDGHTDSRPISTPQFASNWELSAARAISVVKYLESVGIPADRLAAAGFADNRPLDKGTDEIALRRNRRIELKLDQR